MLDNSNEENEQDMGKNVEDHDVQALLSENKKLLEEK